MPNFPEPSDFAELYDLVADDYIEQYSDELSRKPFDTELLEGFAASATGLVADLGCGPGQIGAFLADRGVDVVGIDVSKAMVRHCMATWPDRRFIVGDLCHMPLANQALGGAVAFYCLQHLRDDDLKQALLELFRVVAPGGRILLAVHVGEGEVRTEDWYGKGRDVLGRLIELDKLKLRLETIGFDIERVEVREPYEFEYPTKRAYVVGKRRRYR